MYIKQSCTMFQSDFEHIVTISADKNDMDGLNSCRTMTMAVSEMENWTKKNMNGNNMLAFNNISMESYVYMLGLMSDKMFEGAMHFMYMYCKMIGERDVHVGIENIEYLRTYLKMFRTIFKKIVKKIHAETNVNVSGNVNVTRMENNLTNMIDMTLISKYNGDNDYKKIKSMQVALQTEYRFLQPMYRNVSATVVKDQQILSSIVQLYELSYMLWSPKN